MGKDPDRPAYRLPGLGESLLKVRSAGMAAALVLTIGVAVGVILVKTSAGTKIWNIGKGMAQGGWNAAREELPDTSDMPRLADLPLPETTDQVGGGLSGPPSGGLDRGPGREGPLPEVQIHWGSGILEINFSGREGVRMVRVEHEAYGVVDEMPVQADSSGVMVNLDQLSDARPEIDRYIQVVDEDGGASPIAKLPKVSQLAGDPN